MASLLATNDQEIKPKYQWDNLLKSIGQGLAEGASAKDMQRILSFSYYDLPSHLKTCLLYPSVFPEDYEIRRDRLIWRWIAEGFVQVGKQETRLFEFGESYFNELANRNLIQPVDFDYDGRARACRVHDMVLDLICSLSSGENFVTIWDGTEGSTVNSQSKVCRLSFQNSISELNTTQIDTTSMSQVRSVTLFTTDVDLIQSFSCFQLLRVLDLERCYLGESILKIDLRYVENLLHLRYLGLGDTLVGEQLMEVGKLKFLETLDLRGSAKVVPASIVHLRRLMCLYIESYTKMPVGMGNLTSLEELTELYVDDSSAIFEELGQLMELRVLELVWHKPWKAQPWNVHDDGDDDELNDKSACNTLMVSLSNLRKMQSLSIENRRHKKFDAILDTWVPPPHLRTFRFSSWTTTLPTWITSSSFPLLSSLSINVDRVRTEVDIQILGTLPALRYLWLMSYAQYTRVKSFIVGADAFPCLKECTFKLFQTGPYMFPRGAMPRLENLKFFSRAMDVAGGDLNMGMDHLPSLQRVSVGLSTSLSFTPDTSMEEAEPVLRLAADMHPNRPTIHISREPYLPTLEVIAETD